jgi:tetratricopeptide (TPR) repeat protein
VGPSYVDPEQSWLLQGRFNPHLKVHEQLRLYCVAALEIRLGDLAAARLALRRMREIPAGADVMEFIGDLAAIGEARIAYGAEDYATALTHLERVRQCRYPVGQYSAFFQRGDASYLRARCLIELGRFEEAPGWFAGAGGKVEFQLILGVFGRLGEAEAMEGLGRLEDAARNYRKFIELMDGCDSEFEGVVAEARERLQSLERAG